MKKYINELTAQEVIERLKKGEVAQTDKKQRVEYIDGFLVGIKENEWFLFPSLSSDNLNAFYFDIPEPELQIEVGQFYKTRDGKKAYAFSKNSEGKYCVAIEGEGVYTVFEGGYYSEEEETDNDLVSLFGKKNESIKKDTKEIIELLKQGKTYKYINEQYGLSRAAIAKLKSKNGIKMRIREKEEDLLPQYRQLLLDGFSLSQIARKVGKTANGVYYFVVRHDELKKLYYQNRGIK